MTLKQLLLVGVTFLSTYSAQAAIKKTAWGKTFDGRNISLYLLKDEAITVQLTDFGARIVTIETPDRYGKSADVVLGFRDTSRYVSDPKAFFGATVGRYANRIAKGAFELDGHIYQVPVNNNGNAMHGGPQGFSTKLWDARTVGPNCVEFTLHSPDGDMGFPGAMTLHVSYMLAGKSLRIDYSATTSKATVINLTNHTYFNLSGDGSGDILNERIQINADRFTPIDSALLPTGEIAPVADTPFDFRKMMPIGKRIDEADEQLRNAGGYDHNFVLNGRLGEMHTAAFVFDPASGRTLTAQTTQPGVQFYSGNHLTGTQEGYSGTIYRKYAGFCLETQHFPDSPNHPNFPSTMLLPGKTFHSSTIFTFGIAKSNTSGD